MLLPQINFEKKANTQISIFRGLNKTCNTGFSRVSSSSSSIFTEFKNMYNMSSDNYPQLSPRKNRKRLVSNNDAEIISNILSCNSGLIYIDKTGNLVCKGRYKNIGEIDTDIEHQLVQYGNNILIFPEKKFINLTTYELTDMEQFNENCRCSSSYVNEEYDNLYKCSIDKIALNTSVEPKNKVFTTNSYEDYSREGNQLLDTGVDKSYLYKDLDIGDTVEVAYNNQGVLWMCTSKYDDDKHYSSVLKVFTEITNYYVRISAVGIGTGLKKGDFIKIYGMEHDCGEFSLPDEMGVSGFSDESYIDVLNNNIFKLYAVDNDYIVIKANINCSVPYCGKISVSRTVPDMDIGLIIEVDNRLWGCSSKNNEIYACKQGDCTNWNSFADGISTDSFAMTVGCEGEFTGIARQNSSVIFFKENWVLKIYGTKPSNFTLASYNVAGVEKGSYKSVVWLNGILFYKTKQGIVEYQVGAQPQIISEYAFGNEIYRNCVGGRYKSKYYVSCENSKGNFELFVFDTEKGLWHKEDNTQMLCCITYNDVLYYQDGKTRYIYTPDIKTNLIESSCINMGGTSNTGDTFNAGKAEFIYGDINNDGLVNADDYDLVQKFLAEETELSEVQIQCADVDNNSMATVSDATAIERYIYNQTVENEDNFEWFCETGDLYDSDLDTKYISRLNIGIKPDEGTSVKIFVKFSENREWKEISTLRYDEKKPRNIPVMLRRSEFLRLRLEGKGYCEIYGISITYAKGSDIR